MGVFTREFVLRKTSLGLLRVLRDLRDLRVTFCTHSDSLLI
jgi:hypothetical protein